MAEKLASEQKAYEIGGTGTVLKSGLAIKMLRKDRLSAFNVYSENCRDYANNRLVTINGLRKNPTLTFTPTALVSGSNVTISVSYKNDVSMTLNSDVTITYYIYVRRGTTFVQMGQKHTIHVPPMGQIPANFTFTVSDLETFRLNVNIRYNFLIGNIQVSPTTTPLGASIKVIGKSVYATTQDKIY